MRICGRCGAWLEATTTDRTGDLPQFVCPVCGRRETLARCPLWWIAGSAGAGKSALMPHLRRALPVHELELARQRDFGMGSATTPLTLA